MRYSSDFTFPSSAKCSRYHQSNLGSVHQVPITAGWSGAVWIQSLPKVFIQPALQELKPRPLDLESDALTTRPRSSAPMTYLEPILPLWCLVRTLHVQDVCEWQLIVRRIRLALSIKYHTQTELVVIVFYGLLVIQLS